MPCSAHDETVVEQVEDAVGALADAVHSVDLVGFGAGANADDSPVFVGAEVLIGSRCPS